jgi:hypothetical protein
MKKLFVVCSLMVALIVSMAVKAEAIPIDGALSFSGTSVQNNLDLRIATAFTEFSHVVVSATGGAGDYASILTGQSATFSPFTFRPSLSPDPLAPLWTFEFSGDNYSFDATGLNISYSTRNTITMYGPGIAHIAGFEDTAADWYFSANGAGGTSSFSFSAIAAPAPVPEPATMLLLGSGLAGLATFIRRKNKK